MENDGQRMERESEREGSQGREDEERAYLLIWVSGCWRYNEMERKEDREIKTFLEMSKCKN
jgi:hypothetical protein